MKSPFPGMDPYLEPYWLDVHGTLITLAKLQLQGKLPDDLRAASNERVIIASDEDGKSRSLYPDVSVIERPWRQGAGTGAAVADRPPTQPLIVQGRSAPLHQQFIEIIERKSGGRVVTVIEFLSPTNKLPGQGRREYRRKQRECRRGGVNLVEIDLTRRGRRRLLVSEDELPTDHRTPYLASVWRATRPSLHEVYAIWLQQPLPNISVPLRPDDPDVHLDLQPLIETVNETGRYDIDYRAELDPPLDADDHAWAVELLVSHIREKT